jgi:hypothetical protein
MPTAGAILDATEEPPPQADKNKAIIKEKMILRFMMFPNIRKLNSDTTIKLKICFVNRP